MHSDCPQQATAQPKFPGFTSQALRILSYFTSAAGTQRSEDCLVLNIWAKPSKRSANLGQPVWVLFHGGRMLPIFTVTYHPFVLTSDRFRWRRNKHTLRERSAFCKCRRYSCSLSQLSFKCFRLPWCTRHRYQSWLAGSASCHRMASRECQGIRGKPK